MSWELNGNAGTDPSSMFLGTPDAQPLIIKTRNEERLRITPFGGVGIGTTDPSAAVLEVDGKGVEGLGAALATTLRGRRSGTGFAGFFHGLVGVDGQLNVNQDIVVGGDVKLLGGGDLAEEFDVVGDIEADPGSVMGL